MKAVFLASLVIVIGIVVASLLYFSDQNPTGNVVKKESKTTIKEALQEVKTIPTVNSKTTNTPSASKRSRPSSTPSKVLPNQPTPSPTVKEAVPPTTPTQTSSNSVCYESWSCSDWSACQNGQQIRTCTDSNNCGTTKNKPTETQSCQTQTSGTQLELSISTNNQTIQRGSDVEITAKVTDGTNPVASAQVEMTLTYASGTTQHQNTNFTDSTGQVVWTKTIGGNSKPGVFTILGKASKTGYLDGVANFAFEVVNKTV